MILYHGTSTEHLASILKSGLQPREVTGRKSNWAVESKLGLVYLTTAYPVYFAIEAAGDSFDPVVIEVDVESSDLYPDEDFLAFVLKEQAGSSGTGGLLELSDYNLLVDPKQSKSLTKACLEYNGIAAIESVPVERVLRHVTLDYDIRLYDIGGDSQPTPINYQYKGAFYRKCIEALFAEGIDAAVRVAKENAT